MRQPSRTFKSHGVFNWCAVPSNAARDIRKMASAGSRSIPATPKQAFRHLLLGTSTDRLHPSEG